MENSRSYLAGSEPKDSLSISYSMDGNKCTFITSGKITFDNNKATLTFPQGNLVFSRSESSNILTTVKGEINGKKIEKGENYLNYIPLVSFAGDYTQTIDIKALKIASSPTMTITNKNQWQLQQPDGEKQEPVKEFNYFSAMFTLTHETSTESTIIFLGTGKTGLLAYFISKNKENNSAKNYLLSNHAFTPAVYPAVKNISPQSVHALYPFTGFYTFEKNTKCFFSVYTTVSYTKNNGKKNEVILTYCIDGEKIISLVNVEVSPLKTGDIQLQWFDGDKPFQVKLTRNKNFDPKDSILTTIAGFDIGNGINTTNITPLSLFAGKYQYQSALAGKKVWSLFLPILEITNDEKVFVTWEGHEKYQVPDYTFTGAMYLLSFKTGNNILDAVDYTFMLGVSPYGLCAYGMVKSLLINEVFFVNTIKPN